MRGASCCLHRAPSVLICIPCYFAFLIGSRILLSALCRRPSYVLVFYVSLCSRGSYLYAPLTYLFNRFHVLPLFLCCCCCCPPNCAFRPSCCCRRIVVGPVIALPPSPPLRCCPVCVVVVCCRGKSVYIRIFIPSIMLPCISRFYLSLCCCPVPASVCPSHAACRLSCCVCRLVFAAVSSSCPHLCCGYSRVTLVVVPAITMPPFIHVCPPLSVIPSSNRSCTSVGMSSHSRRSVASSCAILSNVFVYFRTSFRLPRRRAPPPLSRARFPG